MNFGRRLLANWRGATERGRKETAGRTLERFYRQSFIRAHIGTTSAKGEIASPMKDVRILSAVAHDLAEAGTIARRTQLLEIAFFLLSIPMFRTFRTTATFTGLSIRIFEGFSSSLFHTLSTTGIFRTGLSYHLSSTPPEIQSWCDGCCGREKSRLGSAPCGIA